MERPSDWLKRTWIRFFRRVNNFFDFEEKVGSTLPTERCPVLCSGRIKLISEMEVLRLNDTDDGDISAASITRSLLSESLFSPEAPSESNTRDGTLQPHGLRSCPFAPVHYSRNTGICPLHPPFTPVPLAPPERQLGCPGRSLRDRNPHRRLPPNPWHAPLLRPLPQTYPHRHQTALLSNLHLPPHVSHNPPLPSQNQSL